MIFLIEILKTLRRISYNDNKQREEAIYLNIFIDMELVTLLCRDEIGMRTYMRCEI